MLRALGVATLELAVILHVGDSQKLVADRGPPISGNYHVLAMRL